MNESTAVQRTLGLDLSDRDVHYALVGSDGTLLREGRVPNTAPALQELVSSCTPRRVVLEAGTHSPWIDRLLRAPDRRILVVNPNRLRAVSDSVRKTDRNDARLLAQLGHAGVLLWEVHHRSEDAQRSLQLLMARDKVVGCRTQLINQLRGQAKSLGHRLPACEAHRFHLLRELACEINPDFATLVDLIATLSDTLRTYDQQIRAIARSDEAASRLMTIPGIGPITALAFTRVLDDPTRFQKSRQVGPYLGLTARLDQSGQLDKSLGITKAGHGFLRKLLVSAAFTVLRTNAADSGLRAWGLALHERGGRASKKKAAVAVARRLAVIMHRIWTDGTTWTADPKHTMT